VDQAEDDYKTAKAMFRTHRWGYTCFCSQQALEKIFKGAIIELVNKRPPRSHDLVKLAKESSLELLKSDFEILDEITQHYFRVRYPDVYKKIYSNEKVAKTTFEQTEK